MNITLLHSIVALPLVVQGSAAQGGNQSIAPGLVWGDFDRDGLEDVYVLDPSGLDRLLRNSGDGSFEDVTALADLALTSSSHSAAWGDFDRDGWIDLYVSSQRGGRRLLRNLQDGRFEDRTREAGFETSCGVHDARWLDYDVDGFVDLLLEGTDGSRLLHNRGDATFESVLELSGPPVTWLVAVGPAETRIVDVAVMAGDGLDPTESTSHPGHSPRRMHAERSIVPHGTFPAESGVTTGTSDVEMISLIPTLPGGGVVPSGGMILGETQVAPPGYVFAGLSVFGEQVSAPWAPRASMPTARGHLAAAAVNGKIYAIGGIILLATVEEYDPATNAWTSRSSMPTARSDLAAAVANGKVYAIGGFADFGVPPLATVEEYDPATNTWTSKASMSTGRVSLAAAAVNGKIYAIGGYDGSTLASVEEYDPATNAWTPRTSMPTARAGLAAAAVNGKIYAIGGNDGSTLASVEEYDPATNTWTPRTSMPTARTGLAAAVVNGRIYAIGGGGSTLASVAEYDPATNTWTPRTSMPTARAYLAAAAVNARIYAIGGGNGPYFSTVEEYTPGRPLYVHRKD